jgi:hypothetical protein
LKIIDYYEIKNYNFIVFAIYRGLYELANTGINFYKLYCIIIHKVL